MPTCASIPRRGSCRECWSIGLMIGCSSPTPTMSGDASVRPLPGAAPVRWLVFDAEALSHVDATGVSMLTELIESLREESITFVLPASTAR